jgi:hypothetical protein
LLLLLLLVAAGAVHAETLVCFSSKECITYIYSIYKGEKVTVEAGGVRRATRMGFGRGATEVF